MVVKHEKIATIVDRSRWVLLDNAATHCPTVSVVIRSNNTQRDTLLLGITSILIEIFVGGVHRGNKHIALLNAIYAPRRITAVMNKVLELDGTAAWHTTFEECIM